MINKKDAGNIREAQEYMIIFVEPYNNPAREEITPAYSILFLGHCIA